MNPLRLDLGPSRDGARTSTYVYPARVKVSPSAVVQVNLSRNYSLGDINWCDCLTRRTGNQNQFVVRNSQLPCVVNADPQCVWYTSFFLSKDLNLGRSESCVCCAFRVGCMDKSLALVSCIHSQCPRNAPIGNIGAPYWVAVRFVVARYVE